MGDTIPLRVEGRLEDGEGKQMTENTLNERPVRGRPFLAALWVLGAIAIAQLIAFAYGVMRLQPVALVTTPPVTAVPAPESSTPASAEVPPESSVEIELPPIPPELLVDVPLPQEARTRGENESAATRSEVDSVGAGGFLGPVSEEAVGSLAGRVVSPAELEIALEKAAAANPLADEPILEALLKTGTGLRTSGNTQGAMQAFREVETAMPGHPRVLSEIAATLGFLGLKDKATAYWERVEALGEIPAGTYFPIAVGQLRGEVAPAVAELAPPTLKIGEIRVEEQAPTGEGQKVSLHVVIDSDPALRPEGAEMALLVYFYDIDSAGVVSASTADTSYLYPSEPYDWQVNGTEEIVVNYHQPVFTEEETRNLGERRYHGYAIELYYRDLLQDKVAMPEDVAVLRLQAQPPSAPSAPAPLGPENALFPDPVNP